MSAEETPAARQAVRKLHNSPIHMMRRALQNYTASWLDVVGDTTPAQFAVLVTLQAAPGLSQTGLGRITGIDTATLTPLLLRLEGRGLLNREVDSGNRRRRVLRLTPAGDEETSRLVPLVDSVDAVVLGGLPANRRTAFLETLHFIADIAD
ncbi:MarR family transcriptional regulator [Streptomyces sp. SID685]|uniref:MarR family winged helix-turn-helix transcriptional regulator n=1 Tax=Streptomyces griseofuscus TaxID=146922 RepID=UPI001406F655|nr:MarR family transcriptional regulator [Streptomyces sp. SID685]